MKAVKADASDSGNSSGFVRAILAIPEHAVRVIASPPETLTQRNVEAVTGLSPRTFLELIRSSEFPLRVRHIGKLRVVNREAFVQWLLVGEPKTDLARSLVFKTNEQPNSDEATDNAERANELLASVGLRELAPARRSRRKR